MAYHSNIQSIIINKGKVERVTNSRMTHKTRTEAYKRVLAAWGKEAANLLLRPFLHGHCVINTNQTQT